jgi:hypothetical protein
MALSKKQSDTLLATLEARFKKHVDRHKGIEWAAVRARLESKPEKLRSLQAMEETGGEPDVIGHDRKSGEIVFCDCAAESPSGRRSACYDREARTSRKEAAPKHSAVEMAADMGIRLMSEAEYRDLQKLGSFDEKTSSWIETPAAIRKLGGALFCDRRYDTVFVYHNGAQSYYAARGFRGILRV